VTSEVAAPSTVASGDGNPVLARTGCLQQAGSVPTRNGLLTVIDAAAAEANPGTAAILATIDAGCSPARMAETRDQKTLWVSARGDDRLLAFDTATLELNPDAAAASARIMTRLAFQGYPRGPAPRIPWPPACWRRPRLGLLSLSRRREIGPTGPSIRYRCAGRRTCREHIAQALRGQPARNSPSTTA
jgi:hypothetical protein